VISLETARAAVAVLIDVSATDEAFLVAVSA
jgi:hypothetical protein